MQGLTTSDYRGWHGAQEDDESYPLYVPLTSFAFCRLIFFAPSPLVMKIRSRSGSVRSGASTPGGTQSNNLTEGDLEKADAALNSVVKGQPNGNGHVNGR